MTGQTYPLFLTRSTPPREKSMRAYWPPPTSDPTSIHAYTLISSPTSPRL